MEEFSSDPFQEGIRPWLGPLLWIVALVAVFGLPAPNALFGTSAAPVIAGILASGAMLHAGLVLIHQGARRAGAEMTYQIDDSGLVQSRSKHPDLRIAFDQIASVIERKDWLIICSRIQGQEMMVYRRVNDYDKLRHIVSEHHEILTGHQPIRKNTYFAAARLIGIITAWALFLLPGNAQLRFAAAAAVVVLFAWASPAYWNLCRRASRLRAAAGLGAAWATTIYLLLAYWPR